MKKLLLFVLIASSVLGQVEKTRAALYTEVATTLASNSKITADQLRTVFLDTIASAQSIQSDGRAVVQTYASLTSALDLVGSTRGAVLYRGATGWTVLTPGTSGQVFTSGGIGQDPTWTNVASGSASWGTITGTLSSQTDLQSALNAKENSITAGTTSQYWRGDKSFQTLNSSAVGLGNVDNTSDANKPVSTAAQTALNLKENTITTGTTAQYWRGDKSFQTLNSSAVGLGNVDNTSDANKPVSTTTQTALNLKENSITAGTTAQYWRGDKTFQTLNSSAVGLGNVDNTSDANKPVSTATQTALNLKANTSSLATVATTGAYNDLTGKPTLGTAAALNVPASGNAASGEVVKGSDTRLAPAAIVTITGNTTLTSTHRNKWIRGNSATDITLTLDTSSLTAEDEIYVEQQAAGKIIIAGSGVTLNKSTANATISTRVQYSVIGLKAISTSVSTVFGDVTQ